MPKGTQHEASTSRTGRAAAPYAGKVAAPRSGSIYWGAFAPAVATRSGLAAVERETGRRPAIAMWYQAWAGDSPFPAADASRLEQEGVVPMITWEAWRQPRVFGTLVVNQPRFALARIAAGAFDSYIRRYALEIKRYGGPVMLRPFHEMNGFWYPWGGTVNGNSAHAFIAAWRHIHDVFAQVGADNVTWVWSVNARSVPTRRGNTPADYWPGSQYVDWIGISGFNWGHASDFGTWSSFDQIYRNRIESLLRYGKPIALTEIGAAEVGGDKAAWIKRAFARVAHYPRVRAVVWYDKRDSHLRDWRIASSPAAQTAFAQVVSSARVLSAPAAVRAAPR